MSSLKFFSILLLSVLLCSFGTAHEEGYTCMHDKEYVEPDVIKVDEYTDGFGSDEDARVLYRSSYPNLRLASDYQYLNEGSASFKNYVMNDLVPAVVSYFENALRVKRPLTSPLRVERNVRRTCEYEPPEILRRGVEADHLYFYTATWDESNYVATASYCILAEGTNRPIISRVKLNMNYLKVPYGDHLTHEKNTYMLMHEMIHALGFSYQLFPKFISSSGRTLRGHIKEVYLNGNRRHVLDVPPITSRVRNHFGCSSLPGAYMEQNGDPELTANSHFERRHFLVDLMTSGVLNSQRITELTLAVLESSGWYLPDYNYAEPNPYGAGQGCSFVNSQCSSANRHFDDLCSVGHKRGCFVTGKGGGFCQSDPLSDGCMYHNPTVNFDCENPHAATQTRLSYLQVFGYNTGSKCFDGTLSNNEDEKEMSFCFRFNCHGSGYDTTLTVQVGNRNVECRTEGIVTVPGYRGHINCPNPQQFCATTGRPYCKRNCMGRGRCDRGTCVCDRGWTGHDCSERI